MLAALQFSERNSSRKEMLNAANIYLLGIILTKWKYIYRSFDKYIFGAEVNSLIYNKICTLL